MNSQAGRGVSGTTDIEGPVKVAICAVLFAVSVAFVLESLTFHQLAMYAPLAAGVLASTLLGTLLIRETIRALRRARGDGREYGRTMEATDDVVTLAVLRSSAKYVLILGIYAAAIYVVRMVIASVVALAALLALDARAGLRFIALSVTAIVVAFYFFQRVVELQWPDGVLGLNVLDWLP